MHSMTCRRKKGGVGDGSEWTAALPAKAGWAAWMKTVKATLRASAEVAELVDTLASCGGKFEECKSTCVTFDVEVDETISKDWTDWSAAAAHTYAAGQLVCIIETVSDKYEKREQINL